MRSTRLFVSVAVIASFALAVTACSDGMGALPGGDAGVSNGTPCITGQTRNTICRNDCLTGQVPEQSCVNGAWNQASCVCTGTAVESCVPNSNRASTLCAGTVCGAGQTAAQICNSTGVGYACGCVTTNAVVRCTVGVTDTQFCSTTCPLGQAASRTCGGDGTWGNCGACTGTTTPCVPNEQRLCTGTVPAGCTGTGQYTREICGATSVWSACTCLGTTTPGVTCTPGHLGTPTSCPSSFTCLAGTVMRQQCNITGSGFTGDCECVADGIVMNSVCPAGQMVPNGCMTCSGSGQYAAQQCNTTGTALLGGTCRCLGGATVNPSGAQTLQLALDTNYWMYVTGAPASGVEPWCSASNLRVRLFNGLGEQVLQMPMLSSFAVRDWKEGAIMFDVICASASGSVSPSAAVHPLLWLSRLVNQPFFGHGVTFASVTGGPSTARMANQASSGGGRFCVVSNSGVPSTRLQGAVIIDDQLFNAPFNGCPNF